MQRLTQERQYSALGDGYPLEEKRPVSALHSSQQTHTTDHQALTVRLAPIRIISLRRN